MGGSRDPGCTRCGSKMPLKYAAIGKQMLVSLLARFALWMVLGSRVDLVLQNRKGPSNETKSLMISASSKRSRCWPLAKDDHGAACFSSLGTLHAAGSALARCRAPMLRTHGCLVIVIGFFRQRSSHRIYVAILMLPDPFADIDVKGTVCRQS